MVIDAATMRVLHDRILSAYAERDIYALKNAALDALHLLAAPTAGEARVEVPASEGDEG